MRIRTIRRRKIALLFCILSWAVFGAIHALAVTTFCLKIFKGLEIMLMISWIVYLCACFLSTWIIWKDAFSCVICKSSLKSSGVGPVCPDCRMEIK